MPKVLATRFKQIFKELDKPNAGQKYNFASYNVRVSSLEEVFNKIGEQELQEEEVKEEDQDQ